MSATPWAILLCKFNDNNKEPKNKQYYDDLFTKSGIGNLNMVEFFTDMSHGTLDLTGSKTFGWYTIDKSRNDLMNLPGADQQQSALITWAREKAVEDKVNLDEFYNIVVATNVKNTLVYHSTAPNGVICDSDTFGPCQLGQEMGHGYGLFHSRVYGSVADYQDPWDIMSTLGPCFMAPHPVYGPMSIGPGLNAANMAQMQRLDKSRVYNTNAFLDRHINTTIVLRPLHRRDLPGYLAIRTGNTFIEFRVKEKWDAAIPQPVVLIHELGADGRSYLLPNTTGNQFLIKGDKLEASGPPGLGGYSKIEVIDIDAVARTATISLILNPPERPPGPPIGWTPVGIDPDSIIIGDRLIRVFQDSPLRTIINSVAEISLADKLSSPDIANRLRLHAFETISKITEEQLIKTKIPGGVAPLQKLDNQEDRESNKKD